MHHPTPFATQSALEANHSRDAAATFTGNQKWKRTRVRLCQKILEQCRQATRQTVPSMVRPFHVSLVSPFAGFQYKPPFSLLSPIGIRTSALWSSVGTVQSLPGVTQESPPRKNDNSAFKLTPIKCCNHRICLPGQEFCTAEMPVPFAPWRSLDETKS